MEKVLFLTAQSKWRLLLNVKAFEHLSQTLVRKQRLDDKGHQEENALLLQTVFLAEGWRRLHNEELYNFYASPNIITVKESRRMIWAGNVACIGENKNAYNILIGKPEGNRPLGRAGNRLKDNT
jgi:hypothetical protein